MFSFHGKLWGRKLLYFCSPTQPIFAWARLAVRGHEVLQVDSFQHCVVEAFELLGNVAGKVVHRKFNGKPKIVAEDRTNNLSTCWWFHNKSIVTRDSTQLPPSCCTWLLALYNSQCLENDAAHHNKQLEHNSHSPLQSHQRFPANASQAACYWPVLRFHPSTSQVVSTALTNATHINDHKPNLVPMVLWDKLGCYLVLFQVPCVAYTNTHFCCYPGCQEITCMHQRVTNV